MTAKLTVALEKNLEELGNIRPGWDSYGGYPPTKEALEAAKLHILAIANLLGSSVLDNVSIVPCSDGGVQVEWALVDKEVRFFSNGEREQSNETLQSKR